MEIKKTVDGKNITLCANGRIDTLTAPELDEALTFEGDENVTLDLSGVPYMSSAGLRCLLSAQKKMMAGGGSMTLTNIQPAVKEVLDITGFTGILTIA